jgi:hypothetical protein
MIEEMVVPHQLLDIQPEYVITVKGDSMKDAGIMAGDKVRIVTDVSITGGDIVLAEIEGEYTIKTYFVDDHGRHWLVPANDRYTPILLDEMGGVQFWGKVTTVFKAAPHISLKILTSIINRQKGAEKQLLQITQEQVGHAIRSIAHKVVYGRQWYAVYRVLFDYKLVKRYDYKTFCQQVASLVPDNAKLPTVLEMQRMAVQSFDGPVITWKENDAPVAGARFWAYVDIAHEVERLLTDDVM